MSTHGYHHLPSDKSTSSTASNDLHKALLMDATTHDVHLDGHTQPTQPLHHKQLSTDQSLASLVNHRPNGSTADIAAIRGTGCFSKLLPGPFWIKNIIGQPRFQQTYVCGKAVQRCRPSASIR